MTAMLEERWRPGDVIVLYADDGQKDAREVLGSVAPELAQALLAVRRPDSSPACWCHHSRDTKREGHSMQCDMAGNALRRAGVPLVGAGEEGRA